MISLIKFVKERFGYGVVRKTIFGIDINTESYETRNEAVENIRHEEEEEVTPNIGTAYIQEQQKDFYNTIHSVGKTFTPYHSWKDFGSEIVNPIGLAAKGLYDVVKGAGAIIVGVPAAVVGGAFSGMVDGAKAAAKSDQTPKNGFAKFCAGMIGGVGGFIGGTIAGAVVGAGVAAMGGAEIIKGAAKIAIAPVRLAVRPILRGAITAGTAVFDREPRYTSLMVREGDDLQISRPSGAREALTKGGALDTSIPSDSGLAVRRLSQTDLGLTRSV